MAENASLFVSYGYIKKAAAYISGQESLCKEFAARSSPWMKFLTCRASRPWCMRSSTSDPREGPRWPTPFPSGSWSWQAIDGFFLGICHNGAMLKRLPGHVQVVAVVLHPLAC